MGSALVAAALASGCAETDPEPSPTGAAGMTAVGVASPGPFSSDPLTSPPGCGEAVLCDGFEEVSPSQAPAAPWRVDASGASVNVTTERVFAGEQSLHVNAPAGTYLRGFLTVTTADVFPEPVVNIYGRMMVWLDATPPGDVHWTLIEGRGQTTDGFLAKYRYGGQKSGRLMANYDTEGRATDCWDHSQVPMPTARWACVEWHFDAALESLELWVDGDHINDAAVVSVGGGCIGHDLDDRWVAPQSFEELSVGFERYQEAEDQALWLDEVQLGTERLGCPAVD